MAKKRYHQSMRDRMHESQGEFRHMLKEARSREAYADYDSRRRLEHEDYYMIHEDKSAMANLPQEAMIKQFPRTRFNLDPYLDDTQVGIDRQIDGDLGKMRKHLSKSKY